MKSTPMLMSGPLVVPTLAGWKTHTSRPMKNQPPPGTLSGFQLLKSEHPCPFGTVGDQVWIRETWKSVGWRPENGHWIEYRADEKRIWREAPEDVLSVDVANHKRPHIWRPSIHMPRWASRITLEVTEVSVFRVQDITEEAAKREGITNVDAMGWTVGENGPCKVYDYRAAFGRLWTEIYGAESWAANPWVWGIGFKRVAT